PALQWLAFVMPPFLIDIILPVLQHPSFDHLTYIFSWWPHLHEDDESPYDIPKFPSPGQPIPDLIRASAPLNLCEPYFWKHQILLRWFGLSFSFPPRICLF